MSKRTKTKTKTNKNIRKNLNIAYIQCARLRLCLQYQLLDYQATNHSCNINNGNSDERNIWDWRKVHSEWHVY